ncbi:MAG: Tad domain-containing protein [bacterium]
MWQTFRSKRGSFLVGGAFFVIVFLMVAGVGVDLSRYYNQESNLQSIADAAALQGSMALQQYSDDPDPKQAYEAIWNVIRSRQDDRNLEMYRAAEGELKFRENDEQDHIEVRKMTPATAGVRCSQGDTEIHPCYGSSSDTFFLVGVVVYSEFESFFMPRGVFGDQNKGMHAQATAIVEPKSVYQTNRDESVEDCGIYFGEDFQIDANNFDESGLDFCGSEATGDDVEVDLSGNSSTNLGEIMVPDCAGVDASGGASYQDCKEDVSGSIPQFQSPWNTAEGYIDKQPDVSMTPDTLDEDLTTWSQGDCRGGYLQMQTDGGDLVEWSDGEAVCLQEGNSTLNPRTENGNSRNDTAFIQTASGNSVDIQTDNMDVSWEGGGLRGDLIADTGDISVSGQAHFLGDVYSSDGDFTMGANENVFEENVVLENGDIDVTTNNNKFNGAVATFNEGDLDVDGNNNEFLGNDEGVALNIGGDAQIDANNVTVHGILKVGGDLDYSLSGSANFDIRGLTMVQEDFDWAGNANNTSYKYDPTKFNQDVLNSQGWIVTTASRQNKDSPLFSNVQTRLVSR